MTEETKRVFVIEKNIPIPPKQHTGNNKYPLKIMEVGDSFIYNDYSRKEMTKAMSLARANTIASKGAKEFTSRKTDDNKVRVWRIK